MQFEVDLILFSEMQPSIVTNDTPAGLYTLDYNPEHKRKPGRGFGAAIHRSILESCTKLHIPSPLANQASGSSTSQTLL